MWVAWSQLPGGGAGAASRRCGSPLTGAAKLPEDVAGVLQERFGVVLREGYGLTEASPVVTTLGRHRAPPGLGRQGRRRRRGAAGRRRTATTCSPATPARSGCGARTCSTATGRPRGDRRGADRRRLAAHRRRRRRRRRRLPVPRRPGQGPHHRVGLQRVPGRGRGGASPSTPAWPRSAVVGVAHPHTGEAVKAYVVLRAGRRPRRGGASIELLPATTWPATSARRR